MLKLLGQSLALWFSPLSEDRLQNTGQLVELRTSLCVCQGTGLLTGNRELSVTGHIDALISCDWRKAATVKSTYLS